MARNKRPQRRKHYLREWREKLDLTQDRACERLGWPQSKLSRIENNKISLTIDDLQAAALAYGRSEFELLNVNPNVEGKVIDMTDRLAAASAEARQRVTDYAEYVIGGGTG